MSENEYQTKTQNLLQWNRKTERWVLTPKMISCEDCCKIVRSTRIIVCEPYRMGTPNAHFRHTCKTCKEVLFAGNISKRSKDIAYDTPKSNTAK